MLIVYEAAKDRAYWLLVKQYFQERTWGERSGSAQTVTVHIPPGNVLDEDAIRGFARVRDEARDDN